MLHCLSCIVRLAIVRPVVSPWSVRARGEALVLGCLCYSVRDVFFRKVGVV